MTARLHEQAVIVTGGGEGIGRAVVERFVREGARVVVFDRDRDRCESVVERLGDAAVAHVGDVRAPEDNESAVDVALTRFGRLDCVVANAGVFDFGRRASDLAPDRIPPAFDEIFHVNVLGPLLAVRTAAAALRATCGSVVVTVSCAGLYAGGGGPLYVASKHAAVGLVRQLALELAPEVRVNAVAPGFTRTDLRGLETLDTGHRSLRSAQRLEQAAAANVPLRRVADPSDHASLYVLLASRAESGHTTGAVLSSDGGLEVRWPGAGATA